MITIPEQAAPLATNLSNFSPQGIARSASWAEIRGRPPGGIETLAADLTDKDQTIRAVAGSTVAHLLVGLKYDPQALEWFDPLVGESYEMLYQNDPPYLFDSSKFAMEFGFAGTPYADGIRNTAASSNSKGLSRRPWPGPNVA